MGDNAVRGARPRFAEELRFVAKVSDDAVIPAFAAVRFSSHARDSSRTARLNRAAYVPTARSPPGLSSTLSLKVRGAQAWGRNLITSDRCRPERDLRVRGDERQEGARMRSKTEHDLEWAPWGGTAIRPLI